MKKFLSLFLLAIPMLAFVSCHDDNDLPDVDFNFTFENATRVDGKLYAVQGQPFKVASIEVKNKDGNKPAMITAANYYWDYYYIGSSIQPPFAFEVQLSEETPLGEHLLEVQAPLFAEDKEAATAVVSFKVQVVASADDIPQAGESSFTVKPSTSSSATD